MPQKFYSVFVSSTNEDLKEERLAVFDALMKCNCFPVGMERFPASPCKSLELIQNYIDQCDYFVLVSAGIYGSIVPDQDNRISYVEWEYDYAKKKKLPCYSFVVQDVGQLLNKKVDTTNGKLLDAFHKKIKGDSNVNFYTSADDLKASVQHAFRTPHPAIGWIRGDSVSNTSPLIGAWELESCKVRDWNGLRTVKIFSSNEFMWIQFDKTKCTGFICGYYERYVYDGLSIREVPCETSFPVIKEKSQELRINVEGDVLTIEGPLSTGVHIKEKWRRIDWSEVIELPDKGLWG